MIPQTTLDLFQKTGADWLDEAAHVAESIAKVRGSVSIDDVLAVCPRPKYLHKNITGSVFRKDVFRCTGFKKSQRLLAKGRIVCIWSLKSEYYPTNRNSFRYNSLERAEV